MDVIVVAHNVHFICIRCEAMIELSLGNRGGYCVKMSGFTQHFGIINLIF